jgi:hypothetical protein
VTLTPADQDRGLPAAVRQRRRISNHDVAAGAPVHMEATPLEGRPNASNSARTNRSSFPPGRRSLIVGKSLDSTAWSLAGRWLTTIEPPCPTLSGSD